jgi:hypothetical protein
MVLFVMDIATQKVQIAGIHTHPNGDWMKQVARNLIARKDFARQTIPDHGSGSVVTKTFKVSRMVV